MLDNHYKVDISKDYKTYEFVSVGSKGNITKVVRYSEINIKGFYNLGFGDKNPITDVISDLTVSNKATMVIAKKSLQQLLQRFTLLRTKTQIQLLSQQVAQRQGQDFIE